MRPRTALPLAAAAASCLVILPALPAAAATVTWVSPTDAAWSVAAWSAAPPVSGDAITFAGGPRSTYDYPAGTVFSSLDFTNDHEIANGGGSVILTSGITVAAGADAMIDILVETSGAQTFAVASGGSLTFPAQVNADPTSTLTLDIDGTLVVTGNLDGGAGACIQSTGSGVVRFASGGGGVGTCPTYPLGLVSAAAETTFDPGAFLGGTDFVAAGGLFTGGSLASPATVRQLSIVAGGTVSPGATAGTALGALNLWGTSDWSAGTYLADVDAAGTSDVVSGQGQAVNLLGTVLQLRLAGTPAAGQTWTVLQSDVAVNGAFTSPAGVTLADGDEFTSNGQVYSIAYLPGSVTVTWVRAAPAAPVVPAAPAVLPATGADLPLPLMLIALSTLVAGAAAVGWSRRASRRA